MERWVSTNGEFVIRFEDTKGYILFWYGGNSFEFNTLDEAILYANELHK